MKQAWMVQGLQFGDEGKGSIVDYLVRETGADMVVRFGGGPQAAHNVVTPEGLHHCFSQLGSGSFTRARTYLSRFMMIEPLAFINEMKVFEATAGFRPRVYVEESCPVITPWHWRLNRLREQSRGAGRHGSCGMGIGELRQDIEDRVAHVQASSLHQGRSFVDLLRFVQHIKSQEIAVLGGDPTENPYPSDNWAAPYMEFLRLVDIVPDGSLADLAGNSIVLEGHQGILLDEVHGYAPHTTWADCTFRNANRLMEGIPAKITRVGVTRAYMTRHGAGPFPSERADFNWSDHNKVGEWQGCFRQGLLDLALLKYGVSKLGPLDGLAVTHLDRIKGGAFECTERAYSTLDEMWARPPIDHEIFAMDYRSLEIAVGASILIESRGPTASDKTIPVQPLREQEPTLLVQDNQYKPILEVAA